MEVCRYSIVGSQLSILTALRPLFAAALFAGATGCVSSEERMIAIAKSKCADTIKEYSGRGTLNWAVVRDGGLVFVRGELAPHQGVGVQLLFSHGRELSCGGFIDLGPHDPDERGNGTPVQN